MFGLQRDDGLATGWSLLLAAVFMAGCEAPRDPWSCAGAACAPQRSTRNVFQTTIDRQLDLLFVVDDTSAMVPYQDKLRMAYVDMAQALDGLPGGRPSLHAGFVSASACGFYFPSCGLAVPERFLRSETCGQVTNFDGPLDEMFACLGNLGTSGCAPVQPLAAPISLLAGGAGGTPLPGWEGFRRPNAHLQIVFVTATDDASGAPGTPTPVGQLVEELRGLAFDPNRVLVSAVGPGDCPLDPTGATLPPRLREALESFGANAVYVPLCADRLVSALQAVAQTIAVDFGPRCLEAVRDLDPAAPGLQAECVAEETVWRPDGSRRTTVLPTCDDAPAPCFRVQPGTPTDGCIGKFRFDVDPGPAACPEGDAAVAVECVAE